MTGIIKESEVLLKNIQGWNAAEASTLSEEDDRGYGHALRSLGAHADANSELSKKKQKEYLRERALELIDRYGEKIKKVMKPELLEALGIKDD